MITCDIIKPAKKQNAHLHISLFLHTSCNMNREMYELYEIISHLPMEKKKKAKK